MNDDIRTLIQNIPKAEVHFHLDSIPVNLLLRFSARNGIELPFKTPEEAQETYNKVSNLEEFLDLWALALTVVRTEQDYYEIVMEAAQDAKRQNIIYRECMFCYQAHESRGIALETIVHGFARGRKDALAEYGVDLRFIAGIDRTISSEKSLAYVEEIAKYKDELPLVAIGMECQEYGYPAYVHRKAFERARELGIARTNHAGEEVGPESVWDSLCNAKAIRIDHGITSIQDDDLVEYLAKNNILLAICPVSNAFIHVLPDVASSPIKALWDRGVKVSVNSDDPAFEGVDLVGNLQMVAEAFDLSREQVIELVRMPLIYNFSGNEHLAEVDAWVEAHKA